MAPRFTRISNALRAQNQHAQADEDRADQSYFIHRGILATR
jgi:hypothetical protein